MSTYFAAPPPMTGIGGSEALEHMLGTLGDLLPVLALPLILIVLLVAIKRLFQGELEGAISMFMATMVGVFLLVAAPAFVPAMFGNFRVFLFGFSPSKDAGVPNNLDIVESRDRVQSEQAAVIPDVPVPASPAVPSAPIDWNIPLAVGGGVVALALVVAIAFVSFWGVARFREGRAEREALVLARSKRMDVAHERAQKIIEDYTAYLFDVRQVVRLPALSDLGVSQTQEFVEAYQNLMSVSFDEPVLQENELDRVEKLVSTVETTWRKARLFAERTRLSHYTLEEQKRLQSAQKFLNMALDPASTEPERRIAYQRAMKMLEGLVEITELSRTALESQVRLMLTDSAHQAAEAIFEPQGAPRSFLPSWAQSLRKKVDVPAPENAAV